MSDGLSERTIRGELMVGVQAIMIPCKIGKALDIPLLDRPSVTLPAVADVQLLKVQRNSVRDHRFVRIAGSAWDKRERNSQASARSQLAQVAAGSDRDWFN